MFFQENHNLAYRCISFFIDPVRLPVSFPWQPVQNIYDYMNLFHILAFYMTIFSDAVDVGKINSEFALQSPEFITEPWKRKFVKHREYAEALPFKKPGSPESGFSFTQLQQPLNADRVIFELKEIIRSKNIAAYKRRHSKIQLNVWCEYTIDYEPYYHPIIVSRIKRLDDLNLVKFKITSQHSSLYDFFIHMLKTKDIEMYGEETDAKNILNKNKLYLNSIRNFTVMSVDFPSMPFIIAYNDSQWWIIGGSPMHFHEAEEAEDYKKNHIFLFEFNKN